MIGKQLLLKNNMSFTDIMTKGTLQLRILISIMERQSKSTSNINFNGDH